MAMLTVHYFISFICGSFHLLVDPALELIGIPEKLLQVEGIGQLGPAIHGSLMKGIAAAQQLEDKDLMSLQFLPPQRHPAREATSICLRGTSVQGKGGASRTQELTASRRVATSSMA